MGHPALTEFHHMLDAMRAWANNALTGYKEPANRNVAEWDLVRDAQGNVSCTTQLPYPRVLPQSAHALLAIEGAMGVFGRRLVDLATKAGLLDVGLRTMRVSVSSSTQFAKHLVSLSHSGVLLWPTEKAMGTEKAMAYLREAQSLLALVPMDAEAPRKIYEVERYRVAAPDPRTAVVLHLIQHDAKRLRQILDNGPQKNATRLLVSEIITQNGESLFADLKG